MSNEKDVDRNSDELVCSNAPFPLWQHTTGQWVKKKGGKSFYFGQDKDVALRRYEIWLKTGIKKSSGLKEYLNAWFAKHIGEMSFDEAYCSYWIGRWFLKVHGSHGTIESIEKWEEFRDVELKDFDYSRRVYFIQAGNLIKIGSAKNVRTRMATLQTGSGAAFELLFDVPGGYDHEAYLHGTFSHLRVREGGEWFEAVSELAEFVDHVKYVLSR
jgi:hypothetical protein